MFKKVSYWIRHCMVMTKDGMEGEFHGHVRFGRIRDVTFYSYTGADPIALVKPTEEEVVRLVSQPDWMSVITTFRNLKTERGSQCSEKPWKRTG